VIEAGKVVMRVPVVIDYVRANSSVAEAEFVFHLQVNSASATTLLKSRVITSGRLSSHPEQQSVPQERRRKEREERGDPWFIQYILRNAKPGL